MVKTPDQLKNMIEDYIKTTGVQYENKTAQVQKIDPRIQWQFVAAKSITITKLSNRDDRINLDYGIGLSPQHIEKAKQLGNQEWGAFLGTLNELIILQGLTYRYIQKDKVIDGLLISGYVDVEELNRPNLFKMWDTLASTGRHVLNKISSKLNLGTASVGVSGTSDQGIYG